jgi:hypothetical protein
VQLLVSSAASAVPLVARISHLLQFPPLQFELHLHLMHKLQLR